MSQENPQDLPALLTRQQFLIATGLKRHHIRLLREAGEIRVFIPKGQSRAFYYRSDIFKFTNNTKPS